MTDALKFSSSVYSLETIKKAAYRLSDLVSVEIAPADGDIVCTLHFRPGCAEQERERIRAALRAEVLDQDLRASIAEETAPLRNAILAYALSKTGLQGGE